MLLSCFMWEIGPMIRSRGLWRTMVKFPSLLGGMLQSNTFTKLHMDRNLSCKWSGSMGKKLTSQATNLHRNLYMGVPESTTEEGEHNNALFQILSPTALSDTGQISFPHRHTEIWGRVEPKRRYHRSDLTPFPVESYGLPPVNNSCFPVHWK